jgi:hypothetical protein
MVSIMIPKAGARDLRTQWERVRDIKKSAEILMFLQSNDVYDMDHFVKKVEQTYDDLHELSGEISKVDRRLGTLATHLYHVDNLKNYKAVYKKYRSLAPENQKPAGWFAKKPDSSRQDAYLAKHSVEIEAYQEADDYLKKALNGRTEIPASTWKKEQAKLNADRYALYEKFYGIKAETKTIETIRRNAEALMKEETRDAPRRSRGHER